MSPNLFDYLVPVEPRVDFGAVLHFDVRPQRRRIRVRLVALGALSPLTFIRFAVRMSARLKYGRYNTVEQYRAEATATHLMSGSIAGRGERLRTAGFMTLVRSLICMRP